MPSCRRTGLGLSLILGLASAATPLRAQDAWNPFAERDQPRRGRQAAPVAAERPALTPMDGVGNAPWRPGAPSPPPEPAGMYGPAGGPSVAPPAGAPPGIEREALPPPDERARAVERGDLQPVMTSDGTGLPAEFWQGLDAKSVGEMVAQLEIPPRSAAMGALWRRLWTSNATPPAGQEGAMFEALRLEAFYRSGMLDRITSAPATAEGADPLTTALRARAEIGAGDRERGCADAKRIARNTGELPKPIRHEFLLLAGYCAAAADGNPGAAGLAADLARTEGISAPLAISALDAVNAGQPLQPVWGKRVSLTDYRFLELAKAKFPAPELVERAEPALLVALAGNEDADPALRVAAAEAAARLDVLEPARLAQVYRAAAGAGPDPLLRRAQAFKGIETERTPMPKARAIRSLLDDARRSGLYMPVAAMLAKAIESMVPAQEIGWFAETAIEIDLAADRPDKARVWADFAARDGASGAQHWLLLIDIADAKWQGPRGAGFPPVEQLAVRGRMPPELLHRLATVLDALDYQIPIPLWEAASRTPQPSSGHLPATGVLTELQDAAKKKEFARTVLLGMRTLGPNAADGAHMIALGDTIRALKRAGLEADARRLGLEAVMLQWPRVAGP